MEEEFEVEIPGETKKMQEIMSRVVKGESPQNMVEEPKTLKKILNTLGNFMAVQIANYDLSIKERDSNLKKNVDSAFFEFMNRQYGLEKLALKHIEAYLVAINK